MIEPLNKNILVRAAEVDKVSAGGIIIPDSADNEDTCFAEVVAIADEIIGKSIYPGDTVVINQYAGKEVKVDGQHMLLIEYEHVLGLVVENKE